MITVDTPRPPSRLVKPRIPCLALRPRDAAKSLGISERTLWSWTEQGQVPHIRRNKIILYPVDALRDWLKQEVQKENPE